MNLPINQIDALFAEWDRPTSPGCVLAVIHDSEIVYKRAYGMADLERNVPLSTASVFDIASNGKQFTAMLITILERQGLLSPDDPLQKYFPEMPPYARAITLRHLLHHTSGVRDYATLMYLANMPFENFYLQDEILDLILRQKELNFPPGEEYTYSNSGYFLLGIIASRVTGKSLAELMRELILQPLGMHATNFNDDAHRIVKNRALAYSPRDEGGFGTDISFLGGFGDGIILSTVEDLFLWDQNFYQNRLDGGGQGLIEQMQEVGKLNDGEKIEYAFGLMVSEYKGLRMVSHGGSWAGYRSELLRFPEQKFSVICLTNLSSISASKFARRVTDLCLADEFTQPDTPTVQGTPAFVTFTTAQLEEWSGFYQSEKAGNILELSVQDGKLIAGVFGSNYQMAAPTPTHLLAPDASYPIEIESAEPGPGNARTLKVKIGENVPQSYQKMALTPIDPSQLPAYTGAYRSGELNIIYTISLEGEALSLRRGLGSKEALRPVTQDIFLCRDLVLRFTRDEQALVCAFDLDTDWVQNIRFTRE